ncbi:MAG TPA: DUF2252 domain-containing protein [Xanthobacteraceae bacterium]
MKRAKKRRGQAAVADRATHAISREERAAAGKVLRDKIPRERHAWWKAGKDRADPIAILRKSDAGRLPELVPIRYGRMLQSPFAFYRGAAAVMAADLARAPTTGLQVQACGDCHVLNFGGFATPERRIVFDIVDFDETLPAPWEWDVKRLAASIVLAARSIGLSERKGRDCAVACAASYREHMHEFAGMDPLLSWYASIDAEDFIAIAPRAWRKAIRKRIDKAAAREGSELDFPKLAQANGGAIRIREQPPLIFHPEVARAPAFEATREHVFRAYRETLADDRRMLLDRYRVVDAAIKVVGIGSVGRQCWIALLMSQANEPLFLQFKEAVASVLEPFAGRSGYRHHGERVVMGQRLMQPASDIFLGWVSAPDGRQFHVRQLRDAKIKPVIESYTAELLKVYARACGWAIARAHARASEVSATISGYLGGESEAFDQALGNFAVAYADQTERDHAALRAAVGKGAITVFQEA